MSRYVTLAPQTKHAFSKLRQRCRGGDVSITFMRKTIDIPILQVLLNIIIKYIDVDIDDSNSSINFSDLRILIYIYMSIYVYIVDGIKQIF